MGETVTTKRRRMPQIGRVPAANAAHREFSTPGPVSCLWGAQWIKLENVRTRRADAFAVRPPAGRHLFSGGVRIQVTK